jgi:acyl carrier protein
LNSQAGAKERGMAALEEIYALISEITGVDAAKLHPGTDLYADLGVDGDDFDEFVQEFEQRFAVDMSAFLWYFHHGDEGFPGMGALLFKPPYARVLRIPVTPELLLASANAGRWLADYLEHELPRYRLDMLVNQILLGVFAAGVLAPAILGLLSGCR